MIGGGIITSCISYTMVIKPIAILSTWKTSGGIKMKKIDKDIIIYLSILISSWVVIIIYLVHYEMNKQDEVIKDELKYYPINHSEITDSTLYNVNRTEHK